MIIQFLSDKIINKKLITNGILLIMIFHSILLRKYYHFDLYIRFQFIWFSTETWICWLIEPQLYLVGTITSHHHCYMIYKTPTNILLSSAPLTLFTPSTWTRVVLWLNSVVLSNKSKWCLEAQKNAFNKQIRFSYWFTLWWNNTVGICSFRYGSDSSDFLGNKIQPPLHSRGNICLLGSRW